MSSEIRNLADQLIPICGELGLAFDLTINPVKLGPDCYYFYATYLNDSCHRLGFCREEKFYALTGGKTIEILDGDNVKLTKTPKDA
jgi:hypothetical protein